MELGVDTRNLEIMKCVEKLSGIIPTVRPGSEWLLQAGQNVDLWCNFLRLMEIHFEQALKEKRGGRGWPGVTEWGHHPCFSILESGFCVHLNDAGQSSCHSPLLSQESIQSIFNQDSRL